MRAAACRLPPAACRLPPATHLIGRLWPPPLTARLRALPLVQGVEVVINESAIGPKSVATLSTNEAFFNIFCRFVLSDEALSASFGAHVRFANAVRILQKEPNPAAVRELGQAIFEAFIGAPHADGAGGMHPPLTAASRRSAPPEWAIWTDGPNRQQSAAPDAAPSVPAHAAPKLQASAKIPPGADLLNGRPNGAQPPKMSGVSGHNPDAPPPLSHGTNSSPLFDSLFGGEHRPTAEGKPTVRFAPRLVTLVGHYSHSRTALLKTLQDQASTLYVQRHLYDRVLESVLEALEQATPPPRLAQLPACLPLACPSRMPLAHAPLAYPSRIPLSHGLTLESLPGRRGA